MGLPRAGPRVARLCADERAPRSPYSDGRGGTSSAGRRWCTVKAHDGASVVSKAIVIATGVTRNIPGHFKEGMFTVVTVNP